MVGTYPPTACGLATFTSNLSAAIAAPESGWRVMIVRVVDRPEVEEHEEVVAQWVANNRASLARAVAVINSCDAVVLQHEFGLFGGVDGESVIDLADSVRVPLVTVLHTVPLDPSLHQRSILEELLAVSSSVVVMSEAARQRLLALYDADPSNVAVIAHGAAANFVGTVRGNLARPTILSWGLLGPGKGIEHAINAIALLGQHSPAPTYVIAGLTHPKVHASEGERYRDRLRDQSRALGVAGRVHFEGHYQDWASLRELIRSADVVLLPYDTRDQVSSGVLVEALASAKPVVATRFPHAVELLARGAGLLVPQGDSQAMANALERILYDPGLAARMSETARDEASVLLWPAVGATYRALIAEILSVRSVVVG